MCVQDPQVYTPHLVTSQSEEKKRESYTGTWKNSELFYFEGAKVGGRENTSERASLSFALLYTSLGLRKIPAPRKDFFQNFVLDLRLVRGL
jgi:hypothetical protein